MDTDVSKNRNSAADLPLPVLQWADNITIIDLSFSNLTEFDESVRFPPNLMRLDLSHNKFLEVPTVVNDLEHLEFLDISFNRIQNYHSTPRFLHSIKHLDLSHNTLVSPPYWVWFENPSKLQELNLSNNINISKGLIECAEQLIHCTTSISVIKAANCRLDAYKPLLNAFPKAKEMVIGSDNFSCYISNKFETIPSPGLDKCCDIEKLNASNTHIYTIDSSIDIYKSLIEIDLSQNYINSLPNEFGNLVCLETCILSGNKLLYLPESIGNMTRLVCLKVDSNELCVMPNISGLKNLRILDLYDNALYDIGSEDFSNLLELDLALNYLDEPDDASYFEKKEKMRLDMENKIGRENEKGRENGKKIEVERCFSPHSSDEEFATDNSDSEIKMKEFASCDDSSEDWDSDDHWTPHYSRFPQTRDTTWCNFVTKKILEGNFCPIDMHTVSISEKVKKEKLKNPIQFKEVIGQFDDLSDDQS